MLQLRQTATGAAGRPRPASFARTLAIPMFVFAWIATGPVAGKEWAKKMFVTLEHDFGVVARGALAEFDFDLQNIYKEEVHIANVRSSCGCATPSIVNPRLKTWDKGRIHTILNTRSFTGAKSATLTVTIDQPYLAEVQLSLKAFIRQDVVCIPSSVQFGDVEVGTATVRSVAINYAGRPDWRIVDVQTPSYLRARWKETQRGNGKVGYELQVLLTRDAPVGHITDQIVLRTNDQAMSTIPYSVQGRVKSSITVSPKSLALGVLDPGQRVTKQILVSGRQPFRVLDVKCDGDCLVFDRPEGAKLRHFIPVTFTAGEHPGEVSMTIQIQTDIGQNAMATCVATARVRGPTDDM